MKSADSMKSFILLLASGIGLWGATHEPVTDAFKDSAANRWLNKKVLASRALDNMGSLAHWTAFTTGAPEVVDARAAPKATDSSHIAAGIGLSRERSRDGSQSLRMRMPTQLDVRGAGGLRRQDGGV